MTSSEAPGSLPGAPVCAVLLLVALVNALAVRTNDFQVFHTAGARALHGESLYRAEDGRFPFKYAPVVGLLLAPVGALPLRVAKGVWVMASALAVFRFLREAARLASPIPSTGLHFFVLLLLGPYVWHLFSLGQIDGFLLAAMALSERWASRRPALSGLLWALAVLTKPPYLVFLLVSALAREWPRLLALLAFLVALTALALPVWGLGALSSWWALLGEGSRRSSSAAAKTSPCGPSAVAMRLSAWPVPWAWLRWGRFRCWPSRCGLRGGAKGARATGTSASLAATALLSPLGWWTNFIALARWFTDSWGR